MTRTTLLLLSLPLLLAAGPQVTVQKVDESTVKGTLAGLTDDKILLQSPAATIPLDDVIELTTASGAAQAAVDNAPPRKLSGRIIGTTGSWQNNGSTRENVFDGNLDTYFAAPEEHLTDAWVGLDLGKPMNLTEIKYAPRPGQYAKRMIGGKVQGSNDAEFKSATDLVTISNQPPDHTLTTAAVKATATFRYVRYTSTEKGCNIAELEVWGKDPASATPAPSGAPRKLTGKVLGTDGSYQDNPEVTRDKAFDGDLDTFFDAPQSDRDKAWVGLDLGSPRVITEIKYAPRNDPGVLFLKRMVGGKFQGSPSADFSAGVVDLFTISKRPTRGQLNRAPVEVKTPFRYVRYLSPEEGCGNVAEVEFWGTDPGAVANSAKPTNGPATRSAQAKPTTRPATVASAAALATKPASQPTSPALMAVLGDDDQVMGTLVSWTDKSLTLKPDLFPAGVQIPVAALREVWRGPTLAQIQQARALPIEPGPEDAAYVLKDDNIVVVRGVALGIEGDSLQFKFNDEPRKISLAKLVGVTFGGPDAAKNAKHDRSFHQTIQMAGDNTLSGHWTAYDAAKNTMTLQTAWGQSLTLPMSAVLKVRSANGRLTYLSDMKPSAVEQVSYFDRLLPYRVDKSLTGGPIKLIDGEYKRGFSVHARCVLTFDLDGQYQEFKTKVGFQQPEGKLGHCSLRVLADGQPLWQDADARGDAPKPADLSLKVAGVKQLTLEVDFGKDGDTGDRVAWANPRLLRAASK